MPPAGMIFTAVHIRFYAACGLNSRSSPALVFHPQFSLFLVVDRLDWEMG